MGNIRGQVNYFSFFQYCGGSNVEGRRLQQDKRANEKSYISEMPKKKRNNVASSSSTPGTVPRSSNISSSRQVSLAPSHFGIIRTVGGKVGADSIFRTSRLVLIKVRVSLFFFFRDGKGRGWDAHGRVGGCWNRFSNGKTRYERRSDWNFVLRKDVKAITKLWT